MLFKVESEFYVAERDALQGRVATVVAERDALKGRVRVF
jgi:hypothetical protein